MRARPSVRRCAAAGALLVLVALLTACDAPKTVTTAVTYDCQINPNHILLSPFSDELVANQDATAPQAVKPGGEVEVVIEPEPFTVNAGTSGGTVTQISNLVWRIGIPANASLVSQEISGWANVGSATPTSTVSGGNVVITVPGPILSGTPATLPTLTMTLTATGALGSRIEPKVGGTSYASPGLSFNTRVTGTILGTLNPTLACFPTAPNPALQSILISNDVSSPQVTITSPTKDQVITQGATVIADYSCNDGTGVGVASCVGTVADGAPINTSTLGAQTFSVTATDLEGKWRTVTVNYTVVAP
jgi:dehydratase